MFSFMKRRAFRKDFKRAVSDEVLTASERRELSKHGVDQEFADKARADHYLKVTAPIRNRVEKARRLSPNDEAELMSIAVGLAIEPQLGATYAMFRELWASENGEQVYLAPVDAPVLLKSGEECCFCEPAIWGRLKTTKTYAGYSGFSASFRIMKGLSYRVGTLKPRYTSSESVQEVSSGHLCITNKRVLFDGDRKSTSITFARLLNVEPFSNGLEITKESGPHDFFTMSELTAEFAFMVLRELNRS